MKHHPEVECRAGMTKLRYDDLLEPAEGIDVKVMFALEELHREDESHQPEVVVTMQVADKEVIDFVLAEIVPAKLMLAAFATVDEEIMVMDLQELRGGESPIHRESTARAKNRQPEFQFDY